VTEELPVVGAIVHDMAGMLSNVAAFAGIIEQRPDHPSRDEILPVMAREARSAVDALKDLQLARSLEEEWPRADLHMVSIARTLKEVAVLQGAPEWLDAQIEMALQSGPILADEGVFVGLLSRCVQVASAGDVSIAAPVEVRLDSGRTQLVLDLTRATYEGDVRADVVRGRRELRPFALLRAVVERWGGSSALLDEEDRVSIALDFEQ
jgi:hypothetical protein